ncbi:uncharacterized protein LOC129906901 [Episyrphus balteatus]|uniref:uncharacterized protein LOC129906901 n=1 Tax=Episyrphus balteatus TaxID=286459 RepID=UPI0024853462|nr:uncharacterized protein LOC129906901 [Episyrphus balteatus]
MDEVNLESCDLILDENQDINSLDELILQDRITHEMFAAQYGDVAEFFGLPSRTNNVSVPSSVTNIFKWSDDQTHFMLQRYKEYYCQVGPLKKFRKKKDMWCFLALEINQHFNIDLSGVQVEGRYKTVIGKTKAVFQNNRRSGAVRKQIPFESSMHPIIQADDSILPEVCIGPNKLLRKENIIERIEDHPVAANLPSTSAAITSPSTSRNISPSVPSSELLATPVSDIPNAITPHLISSRSPNLHQPSPPLKKQKILERIMADRNERSKIKEKNKERRHEEKLQAINKIADILSRLVDDNRGTS